jgi:protein SCO1/2
LTVNFGSKTVGKTAFTLIMMLLAGASLAFAQMGGPPPTTTLPPELGNVSIDQKLDGQVPLGLHFRDEKGQDVTLNQYFTTKPVILSLVYYDCPMLCTEVLNGMAGMMRALSFEPSKDYEVVTVSFDPREKPELAAAKKAAYLKRYGRPGAEQGWHFLTGDQQNIKALTEAVGFHYQWDPRTQQFAHATAIMVLTPEGKISRYFYGVEYPPRDVRLGLIDASQRKIGNLADAVLLYCYHYDPRTGRYGPIISRILMLSGIGTIIVLAGMIGLLFWLGPKQQLQEAHQAKAQKSRSQQAG